MKVYIAVMDSTSQRLLEEVVQEVEGVHSIRCRDYRASSIEAIQRYRPDLVLLDNLKNKVLDLSLLNALQSNLPEVWKIVFTDIENERYRNLCLDFGADHFVDNRNGTEYLRLLLSDYAMCCAAGGAPSSSSGPDVWPAAGDF